MNDKNVQIWQIVLAIISLGLVIVSMVYWLYGNIDGKSMVGIEEQENLQTQLMVYEEEIATLKEENERLQNMPPKEVMVEKECPDTSVAMNTTECPPCPEPEQVSVATDHTMQKELMIQKPMAISTTVCTKMAVSKWSMPKSCLNEIRSFLGKQLDENRDFFVITPIVDTRKYKGKQPELKQAGLGQYRAESIKKVIKEKVGPNIHIFQKKTMQKHEMRGYVLELYRIGQAE